jgi:hypothetical protein
MDEWVLPRAVKAVLALLLAAAVALGLAVDREAFAIEAASSLASFAFLLLAGLPILRYLIRRGPRRLTRAMSAVCEQMDEIWLSYCMTRPEDSYPGDPVPEHVILALKAVLQTAPSVRTSRETARLLETLN